MWTLTVLLLLFFYADAVDRSKFKTCEQNSFCKRQRSYKSGLLDYGVVKDSFNFDGTSLKVSLHEAKTNTDFILQISLFSDDIVRLRMNEKNPLHPRYVPQDILLEGTKMVPFQSFTEEGGRAILKISENKKFIIDIKTLRFDLYVDDEPVVSANSNGLLYFEHLRAKPDIDNDDDNLEGDIADPESLGQAQVAWDIAQHIDMSDAWTDDFGGHTDNPRGPQSIGVDISFIGADHVYGIPEHATDLALKSTKGEGSSYSDPYRLYNFDVFEYELDEPMALYGHVPMMIGHSAKQTSGVFWFNAAETYVDVFTKESNSVWDSLFTEKKSVVNTHWFSETGIIDVFFFSGPKPKDIFRQFSSLVGTQELPPLFAIAYHQCRWNYQDEQDVDHVNKKFEEHNLPYDVLWLDIEHTDGKRYFTWDGRAFPSSEKMLQNLESYGRKMVTIVDPHIKRDPNYHIHSEATSGGYYVKDENGNDYDGHCWPGSSSWVDFMSPEARKWWASKFAYESYKGSTSSLFTWNDMNEPSVFNGPEVTMKKSATHYKGWSHRDVHNLYGIMMHKATSDGLVQRNEGQNVRSFVLSRAFYAGTQRYGAIWTGDNKASWDHLEVSMPMLLSMGLGGIVFSGADVGGFFGNPEPDLLTRWYQAAVYQPFFRAHAHLDTKRREPWLTGEQYFDIIQDAIETRYHLLPYLYTFFYQAFVDNSPVMRPLWVEYPEDAATFTIQESFLCGTDLLVTPVTKKDQKTVSVYLPGPAHQLWYDIDTYKAYTPNQSVTAQTPLDKTVVFQRGGSIIPRKMRIRRSTVAMFDDPFTLYVAPDARGQARGHVYLDDTTTFDFKKGKYAYRRLSYQKVENSNSFVLNVQVDDYPKLDKERNGGSFEATQRIERVIVVGVPRMPTHCVLQQNNQEDQTLQMFHNDHTQVLTIKKPDCFIADDSWSIFIHYD